MAQGDIIREQGLLIAGFEARITSLREDCTRVETSTIEIRRQLHEVDKKPAGAVRDAERLEQKLDELLGRRRELWKLILAAFLGSLLTVASGFVSRSLDHFIDPASNRVGPASPAPIRR